MHKLNTDLSTARNLLPALLFIVATVLSGLVYATDNNIRVIRVQLGDYHFMPVELQLVAEQPVVLQLVNTDTFTPHNFTLEDPNHGLDVNVDILAGETVEVHLMPLWPGRHTFYCSNKLLFMDSHREKGMQGTLIVVPK